MQKVNWDWYGTWVWDYLNLDRDDISTEAWESYDIWKRAYIEANPELSDLDDLELIQGHYSQATEPIFRSWIFKAWQLFYWPSMIIRQLVWHFRRKFS